MCRPAFRLSAFVAAAVFMLSGPAHGAVTRIAGPTTFHGESKAFVKFDAAFDSINRVYLTVWGTQLTGPVNGLFLNQSGLPVGQIFAASSGPQQSGWARVIYSAPQGKFLISYTKIIGVNLHQRIARSVTYINETANLGPEIVLDEWVGNAGTATGMAYSAPSGKFIVTWARYFGSFPASFATTIDASGVKSGGYDAMGVPIPLTNLSDGQSDPEIACDPVARRCLVVGKSWGVYVFPSSATWARFIDDATAAPQGTDSFYLTTWRNLPDPPAVVFDPSTGQFVVAFGRDGQVIWGLTVNGASSAISAPFVVRQSLDPNVDGGGYGFLSLRYNSSTRTTLATMTTWLGIAAVQEIDGSGAQVSGGFDVIPDTPDRPCCPWDTRNQFSVSAANPVSNQFLVLENHYFKAMRSSIYAAASANQPPAITASPFARIVYKGELVSFMAAASGAPTPSVKWQISGNRGNTWTDISGATSTTYAFWAAPRDTGKHFRAVFTNELGSATTDPAALRVIGMQTSDFDADGRGDLLVWRAASGTWHWAHSSFGFNDGDSKQFGNHGLGDVPLSGDMDGDGITDAIVWRAATGTWYWATSSSQYRDGGSRQWGNQGLGDVPILADMDGDGKSDLVVWRATTGTWYWVTSSSRFTTGFSKQWGNQSLGDVPLIGDFDGDGKADPAVWRASTGWWYWLTSSSRLTNGFMKQFGNSTLGDKPLVGDLDGDGTSDFSVWRASTGTWHWVTSSSGYIGGGFQQWGTLGDRPMLSDIDGDGMADLIVWRGSDGTWYWLNSSNRYDPGAAGSKQFGNQSFGDIPIIK